MFYLSKTSYYMDLNEALNYLMLACLFHFLLIQQKLYLQQPPLRAKPTVPHILTWILSSS